MKWVLLAAVLLVPAVILLLARADDPPSRGAAGGRNPAHDAADAPPKSEPGPLLEAAVPAEQRAGAAPAEEPAQNEGAATPTVSTWTPVRAAVEEDVAKKVRAAPPGGRVLRAGETFTPITELKPPDPEALQASTAKTLQKLEETRPLRVTWSDAPLQEVLKQLSKESGLILALGPGALRRGMEIRVSEPLAEAGPDVHPTIWLLLEALAKEHGFTLRPWERGVLLVQPPDAKQVRLRYYDAKDLVAHEWGNAQTTAAADRLGAVLPDMIRAAAKLDPKSTVEIRNGIVIARQTNEVLLRIDEVVERWRADPKQFRADYGTLISTRHPTVSGAPPREGTSRKGASESGK